MSQTSLDYQEFIQNVELLKIFNKIKNMKNLLNFLCDSIFEDVCGHQAIKQALVLALFGGTGKMNPECHYLNVRDHINVLLLGNRGLSLKNDFLKHLTSLMDNTCYLVGNCSSIKLIANTKKTSGALINENRCIACIDELEKMNYRQQQIIIQSIEHGKIGMKSPSNMFVNCPSNFTFICSGNLNGKQYDPDKSLAQNVRISPDLYSKMDLIFLLDDYFDYQENDDNELFFKKEINKQLKTNNENQSLDDELIFNELYEIQSTNTLSQMILNQKKLLVPSIIVKYIKHCYENIQPRMDEQLCLALQSYICFGEIQSTIIGSKVRIYETITRLAEANAKIHMNMHVSEHDINMALSIMANTLTFSKQQHPTQEILSNKKKKTIGCKPLTLYQLLDDASSFYGTKQFTMDEIIDLANKHLDVQLSTKHITNMIYSLNEQALIIKKPNNVFKLV